VSFGERKTLEQAKRLLICEISEVMEVTKEEAEKQVDGALNQRRALNGGVSFNGKTKAAQH